jgi:signal transduction histidine kinase
MSVRRWLPATVFGLVLALGAIGSALAVGSAAAKQRHDGLAELGRAEAARISAAFERDLDVVERLTTSADDAAVFRRAATPAISGISEIVTIALAQRTGSRLEVLTAVPSDAGVLRTGDDLAAADDLRIVLDRVVGEADPLIGAPFSIDGRQSILIAAPITAARTPDAARRSPVTGVVAAAIDGNTLIGSTWKGRAELVAPDGRAVGAPARDEFGESIDISGRTWTLRLEGPKSGVPGLAWIVLTFGLLMAGAGAMIVHRQLGRRQRAERQASDRSRELGLIADAGSRLQQSLDLAELLPAFAVSVAADFDLQGVSVALIDDGGDLVEAFSTGDVDDDPSIELPLRRGWRAVGVLVVHPGRTIHAAELTSLQALGDLLAVALSNAQLYEREQASAARLRDLDALKNAFLGTVSHELRTSMTAIMGFGELLSDAWDSLDDERRREMADRIRRSAGSLRHLVDDLLDFARLEQERLRVAPRTVDLAGVVRQTVEGLSPLLGHHAVELDIAETCEAWADPVAVERILANLVSNAAKYAPPDTAIMITVVGADGVARLVVADEGPGIPPEERRRIFARFYRLDTPESIRTRGAGIGLAILRDFADRSSAKVTVDDAPGGGARFTVDFPTKPLAIDPTAPSLAVAT